ncbi:ferredoxin [Spiractinospora alimapuensis]|uniref:ferredoxin n=1 Tax=Spiractinospora alimapuensis TaxID=2820884 RepID=UPI001F263275|nr:ferredoxin [Spiractinospora alimapuensis]QVQ51799.1 ferredoxin [Spiractinospora alimapuensis]
MRVHVDMAACANHGQCVFAAPQVFTFDDDENLLYDDAPGAAKISDVEQAARSCPTQAIVVVD